MSREGTKGKHLTLEERINILNDLIKGEKLSDIATKIGKDPTTVSKEIKKHRYCNKRKFNLSQRSYCFFCSKQKDCSVRSLCKGQNCNLLCRNCKFKDPTKICKDFISKTCSMTNRFPYTCHTCEKKGTCFLDRYFYDPNMAEKDYKELLVSSRTGINIEQSEFEKIDSIISDGVSKGKSIYSILLNHPEILKSERTIYRYVGNRYLSIKDIEHLKQFKKDIKSTNVILTGKASCTLSKYNDLHEWCHFSIHSRVMTKDLEKWGIIPNKTGKESFPNIDKKYYPDFIRGYFDGDGCYTYHYKLNKGKYKTLNSSMKIVCMNYKFLLDIKNILVEYANIEDEKIHIYKSNSIWSLEIVSNESIKKFYDYIYPKYCRRYLKRKRNKFVEPLEYIKNHKK